jgi:molecular chaperone DnaK (HSP70)
MKYGRIVGIDMSTTHTAVCIIEVDEKSSRIIHLGENDIDPFSSLVAVPKNGGPILFGHDTAKKKNELSDAYYIFTSMNGYLGDDTDITLGEGTFNAVDIATEYFRYLKKAITSKYEGIETVSFSCPLSFTSRARNDLITAASQAGIAINGLYGEGLCAYLANQWFEPRHVGEETNVLVIEWGADELKFAVIKTNHERLMEERIYSTKLGGRDIDLEIAKRLHAQIVRISSSKPKIKFEAMDAADRDKMLGFCELVKIALTESDEDYKFTVKNYGVYGSKTIEVSRGFLDEIIKPIITDKLIVMLYHSLEGVNLSVESIGSVVLTGGSSNLRLLRESLEQIFGEEKILSNRQLAAYDNALGAAIAYHQEIAQVLDEDIGVVLSDESFLQVFRSGYDRISSALLPIRFKVTDHETNANFIFTKTSGEPGPIARTEVMCKGYENEFLELSAYIGLDQACHFEVRNPSMGHEYVERVDTGDIAFHYKLEE